MARLNARIDNEYNVAVMVGPSIWTVCASSQEAQAAIEGIKTMNRWWRLSKGSEQVYMDRTTRPVTNPLDRAWSCVWSKGYVGWDLAPLPDATNERVVANSTDIKHVYVHAPNATQALERAKFMLMERGKI